MSKTKCAYYTVLSLVYNVLSLVRYCKEKNLQKVKASPAHFILFNESLNLNLQDEQLDFQVHFWEK